MVILLFAFQFVFPQENKIIQLVSVDEKTEKVLGAFPYDRKIYAATIKILKKYKPKAIIVKFFLDLPKSSLGDDLLAHEFINIPIFLQATINTEKNPNNLPKKYVYKNIKGQSNKIFSGDRGWIPLEVFSRNCYDIGFVDVRTNNFELVPIIENFQGNVVKSLHLAVLEFIYGPSTIESGKSLTLNNKTLPLNEFNEIKYDLPKKDELDYLSLIDVLNKKADQNKIKNRIIILGYDGNNIERFNTKIGKLKAQRLFYYTLIDLINKFNTK
jgi:hypothetical protein